MNLRLRRRRRVAGETRRRLRLESLENRQMLAADGMTLRSDSLELDQNSAPVTINVLSNDSFDSDYVGDRLVTSVSTGSLGGRIRLVFGSLLYTPPVDAVGTEVFRYTVDDRRSAEVRVTVTSTLPEFQATVDGLKSEYRFDLVDGDQFPADYSGPKQITLISESTFGSDISLSEDGRSVTYRVNQHRSGKDQFTFIVDDRFVSTATIDVSNPVQSDRFEILQNSDKSNFPVLDNDFRLHPDQPYVGVVSESQWESVRESAQLTHVLDDDSAEFAIASDGRSLHFTPEEGFFGSRRIRYVVDGQYEAFVSVVVQRPVGDDYFNADVDGGMHPLSVLENDYYQSIFNHRIVRTVDEVTSVTQGDKGGTIEIGDDAIRVLYTPADGFVGTETFQYVANGKHSATVTMNVSSPVRDDRIEVYLGTNSPIDVLGNDGLGSNHNEMEITGFTESLIGSTVQIGADGSLWYQPPDDAQEYGRDTIQYTVNGRYTATATIVLLPPAHIDNYTVDDASVRLLHPLLNDRFGQFYLGEALITSVSDPSKGGTITVSPNGKTLTYQPGGPREFFEYTVDEKYSAGIWTNSNHYLRNDSAVADQNGSAITIDVLANDFQFSWLPSYTGRRQLSAPAESKRGGALEVVQGEIRYTPADDFFGKDSFEYRIDGFLPGLVTVDVIRRAADDTVRVAADSQDNKLRILENDIHGADYSGFGLITDIGASGIGAQLSIAPDRRSVVYTPPVGFTGTDTFVYTIDEQSKATVVVHVRGQATPLDRFETDVQFQDYLIDLAEQRYEERFGTTSRDDGNGIDLFSSTIASLEHSETNVQVAGVDEHDIVETDGNYLYALRGGELVIVQTWPADELTLMSRTAVAGEAIGMFLSGGRLTILSQRSDAPKYVFIGPVAISGFSADLRIWPPTPTATATIATVLDISDRSAPSIVQRTEFDGRFVDSRRVDDQVFLVMQSDSIIPVVETHCDEFDVCTYETKEQYAQRMRSDFADVIEQTLPRYQSYDGQGAFVRGGPLLMPEDIYRSTLNPDALTMVASIDMASDESGLSAVSGVLSRNATKLYASSSGIYVFNDFTESVESEQWTKILKFDWNGRTGDVVFAAQGEVPGRMLNQFSADQAGDLLRLTTEVSNSNTGNHSGNPETAVFVLQDDAGTLEFVGSLQNLAVGQNIKSVRYFGDRAFVTTFAQVDPLSAIDLSDPSEPVALGHVPIPGFSSYMQFISPERLLTIGTNTATGSGGRAMVSLFDVGDLTSPKLIDLYNLPQYSTSQANDDHHAFGWFANHDLLSVPTSRRFNERFDDDQDGYKEATRTVRSDDLTVLNVEYFGNGNGGEIPEGITLQGSVAHDAKVHRSIAVEDFVYSVGDDAVRVIQVHDASAIVDELIFDWEFPVSPDPWPRLDDTPLAVAARRWLANEKAIDRSGLMLVTQEQHDERFELVFRSGDDHYRLAGTSSEHLELLEQSFSFADNLRHNALHPLDTNADGDVSLRDALVVINEIARANNGNESDRQALRQIHPTSDYFADTNDDGQITPLDVLRVINDLAQRQAQSAAQAFVQGELLISPTDRKAAKEASDADVAIGQLF